MKIDINVNETVKTFAKERTAWFLYLIGITLIIVPLAIAKGFEAGVISIGIASLVASFFYAMGKVVD